MMNAGESFLRRLLAAIPSAGQQVMPSDMTSPPSRRRAPRWLPLAIAALALAASGLLRAQPVVPGSTAFCLYEVPLDDTGKRRWINLGIVQYVEATRSEVRIYYGGGAFGAGHDVRIPVNSIEEAHAILEKLRRVAAACR